MNSFVNNVELLHKALDVSTLRYQVASNNLANSETPNYKKQYVNFESELARAFKSRDNDSEAFHMTVTDERHIPSAQPKDWREVEPRRVTDYLTTAKANGNNVDAEEEAMNVVQIQMQYELLTRMMNFEFSQVKTAMQKLG